jgi:hypothetical protein
LSHTGTRVGFLVVGTPRSGTTIVQRLALGLQGVVMPPETHFFTDLVPGLLQRRRPPLDAMAAQAEAEEFLRLPNSSGISLDPRAVADRVANSAGSVIDLFDAVVAELVASTEPVIENRSDLVGEKTPDHLMWWKPIARARPNMRFVVVVRHPLDVIASNLAAPFRAEDLQHWGETFFLSMARHWVHHQRLVLELLHDRGTSRALLLRYEDVVADPAGATAKLARFLGQPVAVAEPSASEVVLSWEHWKRWSFEEIVPSAVGTWSRRLSVDQTRRAARIVGRLAHQFGYEVPFQEAEWSKRRWESRSIRARLGHLDEGLRRQQARIESSNLS